MALRIGLLRRSALQNDGPIKPVTLHSASLLRRPIPRAIEGHCFVVHKIIALASSMSSLGIPSYTISRGSVTRNEALPMLFAQSAFTSSMHALTVKRPTNSTAFSIQLSSVHPAWQVQGGRL
jgi:hypothetical protein